MIGPAFLSRCRADRHRSSSRGCVAMYRGLTREVLSILSWVAAAGAVRLSSSSSYKRGGRAASPSSSTPRCWSPRSPSAAIIFLIVLIIVHLITARISDTDARQPRRRHRPHPRLAVRRRPGLRAGGDPLHVLRVLRADKPEQQYPWVRDAMSRPCIKSTGDSLQASCCSGWCRPR